MASSYDAMDAYTSGVMDTVALINENEDMKINWRDVIKALMIKQAIQEMEDSGEL